MDKRKKIRNNIIFGLGGKLITMALGLIVPRLMLTGYGSEVNGLFSTVTNVYTYLAILEAGIGASAIQMLYKPINENDHSMINKVLSSAKKYYHKCSLYYFIGVIITAFALPLILNTSIATTTIVLIVLLQGFASLTNFYVLAGENVILTADGKEYVNSNIQLLVTILTSIAKIVLVNLQVNIVVLQLSYFLISMIQIAAFKIYIKRAFPWVDNNCYDPTVKLKQRNSLLIGNVVYVVFNNTDTIIISIFCGLKSASVYAIYNLVFTSILGLVNAIFNGLKFTLGQTYNRDINQYKVLHDNYKSLYCAFVFSVISVCYLLLEPFMKLYTSGVSDIDYVDPYLPLLFCLVNLLSMCRTTENNLVTVAFHTKQTLPRAIFEAVINLTITLVLVNRIGIYGCLIGTIVALLYRINDIIWYSNVRILKRKPKQTYITIISNFTVFFLFVIVRESIVIDIHNYYQFLIYGILFTAISITVYFSLAMLTNTRMLSYVKHILNRKRLK